MRLLSRPLGTIATGTLLCAGLIAVANPAYSAAPAAHCGRQVFADGSVGPITCGGGQVNQTVFADLKRLSPFVMSLPENSGWRRIRVALCADMHHDGTIPITTDAYTYQYTRFGWSGINPTPRAVSMRLIEGLCE